MLLKTVGNGIAECETTPSISIWQNWPFFDEENEMSKFFRNNLLKSKRSPLRCIRNQLNIRSWNLLNYNGLANERKKC